MLKKVLFLLVGLAVLVTAGIFIYNLPAFQERFGYRIEEVQSQIHDYFAPPEKAVFVPQNQVAAIVKATLAAWTTTPACPVNPSGTCQGAPTSTPTAKLVDVTATTTPAPTDIPQPATSPTPLPTRVELKGIIHEYQKWNNCGPANLAMALSFWKWQGTQDDTAVYLKPNPRDKNVMPYEMASYVTDKTQFKVVVRMGGDIQLLKQFNAAGFPVIVEKGFEGPNFDGWMGHYEVIDGYDESQSRFLVQDSYIQPQFGIPYDTLVSNWRAFNYLYVVIYPAEEESQVLAILGPQADEHANFEYAAQKATAETKILQGRDLYFAWYDLGTSLVNLQDYAGAAAAYDQAYKIYPDIPEKSRPYRMEWYQTGPYFAYFNTGRLQDVIDLATKSLGSTPEPALEEGWVWKARAEAALGETTQAIDDYRTALKWHTGFQPALDGLKVLGVSN